jgi:CRP-like cAMP-binding protein
MEIMTLADSLAEETYVDGSEICKQGDEGNYFYIILQGSAACFQVDAAGKEVSFPVFHYRLKDAVI